MRYRFVFVLFGQLAQLVPACKSRNPASDQPRDNETTRQPTAAIPLLAKPDCKFGGRRLHEDLTFVKSCGPYTLKGGIDILTNVTVTIEPGVEVRFAAGDWLEVAAAST